MTDKKLLSINNFCRAYDIGRTSAYKLIGQRQIETVKIGRRNLIVAESADRMVERLRSAAA